MPKQDRKDRLIPTLVERVGYAFASFPGSEGYNANPQYWSEYFGEIRRKAYTAVAVLEDLKARFPELEPYIDMAATKHGEPKPWGSDSFHVPDRCERILKTAVKLANRDVKLAQKNKLAKKNLKPSNTVIVNEDPIVSSVKYGDIEFVRFKSGRRARIKPR